MPPEDPITVELSQSTVPFFIGIGAPKAATTWLTSVLSAHPGIYLPPIKETHFFDYPYTEATFPSYVKMFRACSAEQLAGEYSTDYLASAQAPERIKKHLPKVKLIVSFRNPIDQIYSNYWHSLRQGFNCQDNSLPDFQTALQRHHDRLIEPARYGHHLTRWLEGFPPNQILIIFHEDVRKDPSAVANRLWEFLGLPPPLNNSALPSQGTSTRQGVSPRSGRAGRIYNRIYFFLNSYVLRPISNVFGYTSATRLITLLHLRTIAEKLFFRPGYPPITAAQRDKLRTMLAEDIAQLSRLTKRDLSHW